MRETLSRFTEPSKERGGNFPGTFTEHYTITQNTTMLFHRQIARRHDFLRNISSIVASDVELHI